MTEASETGGAAGHESRTGRDGRSTYDGGAGGGTHGTTDSGAYGSANGRTGYESREPGEAQEEAAAANEAAERVSYGKGWPERHTGPVVRRRGQVQTGTTDQRLLDSHGPTDWVHGDPWRVMRIQSEF